MIASLRYEWRRFATIRSSWVMVVLVVAVMAGLAGILARIVVAVGDTSNGSTATSPGVVGEIVANPPVPLFAGVFLSVIAAQAIGQEYRHSLIRLTLSAFPRRSQVLVAKLAVLVVIAAVVSVIALALSAVIASAITGGAIDGKTVGILGRTIVFLLLFALLSFAITLLTRSLPLGIVIPIVLGLVVEPIALGLSSIAEWTWVADVLPITRASLALNGDWSDMAPLALLAAAILAVGWALFERRDA